MPRQPWSPSIRRLTLLGFIAVSLPLMLALGMALLHLERLSSEGASAVSEVARSVDASRQVAQLLQNMERTASQYQVLEDPEILSRYQSLRQRWQSLLAEQQHRSYQAVAEMLRRLGAKEQLLHQQISQQRMGLTVAAIQQGYAELTQMSQQLYELNREAIEQRVTGIEIRADELRQTLLQATWLFPVTMVVAFLFLWLIGRPLKRLKQQIGRLEQGDLSAPVSVSGAEDIAEVGAILDAMRRQLLQLEQQKTQFIRQISHELKTPLAAIREGAELLYDRTAGPLTDTQSEVADIIRTSVNRLQHLIEDLLNFNLLLDDAQLSHDSHCQISKVLERVERERRLELNARQLSLKGPQQDADWPVHQEHLRMILDNLVSNAIKFSPEGGVIRLSLSETEQDYRLTVQDQGPGIKDSQRESIFEPFVQAQGNGHSKLKSSGLGLTIVRELMRKYGGTIRAETNDEGGCFILSLPKE
ncbi:Histidine kinase [Saliniradius amylolyticus]|uniref:histidine kinase n=1 Tax=Saliniradius amylolyticus TaxID=2183582 RepID=A0A2S2DZN4_9ALTE|nr:ATP-binding protein [Saliniradius amylolyticus]AWL10851.1 Histidine kinase [Saliniradius amylolyticus]